MASRCGSPNRQEAGRNSPMQHETTDNHLPQSEGDTPSQQMLIFVSLHREALNCALSGLASSWRTTSFVLRHVCIVLLALLQSLAMYYILSVREKGACFWARHRRSGLRLSRGVNSCEQSCQGEIGKQEQNRPSPPLRNLHTSVFVHCFVFVRPRLFHSWAD